MLTNMPHLNKVLFLFPRTLDKSETIPKGMMVIIQAEIWVQGTRYKVQGTRVQGTGVLGYRYSWYKIPGYWSTGTCTLVA